MEFKTIKISADNYRWLIALASDMQKSKGELMSFDEVLNAVRNRKTKADSLKRFAGRWRMSDKEAEEFEEENRKLWKTWKN